MWKAAAETFDQLLSTFSDSLTEKERFECVARSVIAM